jgi:hypothetical protein
VTCTQNIPIPVLPTGHVDAQGDAQEKTQAQAQAISVKYVPVYLPGQKNISSFSFCLGNCPGKGTPIPHLLFDETPPLCIVAQVQAGHI